MVTVATFEGVKINFYFKEHPPPHFHAIYAEFTASISIDEEVILKGAIPPAKLSAIRRWMAGRKQLLHAAFEMSTNHLDPGDIA